MTGVSLTESQNVSLSDRRAYASRLHLHLHRQYHHEDLLVLRHFRLREGTE